MWLTGLTGSVLCYTPTMRFYIPFTLTVGVVDRAMISQLAVLPSTVKRV